ncbi:hypothetical protein NE237_014126 [Protea cynaroides]|uniref:Peptidase M48 domain-containing protein n=1 Tax=Protea cynaroides TaxID=273540 RepID=A0A9Q0H0L4_9MAGN|nr:hypothetical protein NE237_014126 [Protea cynaroides]
MIRDPATACFPSDLESKKRGRRGIPAKFTRILGKLELGWSSDDEILDDKWIDQSQKKILTRAPTGEASQGLKHQPHFSISGGGRRFYFVDRYRVQHLKPKVPYTKRKHLVLLSNNAERQIGEAQFQQLKAAFKEKILPAIHPESWSSDDEILDDKWVDQNRKKERGTQPTTDHLEGLNWEVIVLNEAIVNAFCLPGGKIVVFTGLRDNFRSNAEIATVLGHEVAHAVARHHAKGITKNLWLVLLQLILIQFIAMPDLVTALSHLLLKLPFSRWRWKQITLGYY